MIASQSMSRKMNIITETAAVFKKGGDKKKFMNNLLLFSSRINNKYNEVYQTHNQRVINLI